MKPLRFLTLLVILTLLLSLTFAQNQSTISSYLTKNELNKSQESNTDKDIGKVITEKGYVIAFVLVFFWGILLSFSPCVFPMIPITISVIGAKGIGNPLKGFVLSLFYVLGIAITYAILGLIAASTGSAFGAAMQKPIVLWAVVIIFFLMSLSMFGLFELQLPSAFTSKIGNLGSKNKGGIIGAFLFGIVAGAIAGPCITPVIFGLLTFVAQSGNLALGFFLFFVFALGMGLLFIFIGTFPGLLTSLPKSGEWMIEIKKLMGLILLGVAFYYLKSLISLKSLLFILSITLIFLGIFLGGFLKIKDSKRSITMIKRTIGIILLLSGIFILGYGFSLNQDDLKSTPEATAVVSEKPEATPTPSAKEISKEIVWNTYDEGLILAKEQKKPVMMDFYADWCGYCVKMDKETYPDEKVITESQRFVPIKVDMTDPDEKESAIAKKYQVRGLPTLILINSEGQLQEDNAVIGFVKPDELLKAMQKVK